MIVVRAVARAARWQARGSKHRRISKMSSTIFVSNWAVSVGQHFAVKQVPVGERQDARADLRLHVDQPFAGQMLDRFAYRRAADAVLGILNRLRSAANRPGRIRPRRFSFR